MSSKAGKNVNADAFIGQRREKCLSTRVTGCPAYAAVLVEPVEVLTKSVWIEGLASGRVKERQLWKL